MFAWLTNLFNKSKPVESKYEKTALQIYREYTTIVEVETLERFKKGNISQHVFDTIMRTVTMTDGDIADLHTKSVAEVYALVKKYENTYMLQVLSISTVAHSVLLKARDVLTTSLYAKMYKVESVNLKERAFENGI